MADFNYYFSAFSSNFDLEPVIERYFEQYPNGRYSSYDIVFKTRNEHMEGSFSYVLVFTRNQNSTLGTLNLDDFIKTFVDYNNKIEGNHYIFATNPANYSFPRFDQRKYAHGRLKKED